MLQLLLIVPLVGAIYFIAGYIHPIGFVLDYFSELSNFFFSMHEKVVLMSLLPAPLVPSGDKEPCHLNKLHKSDKKALLDSSQKPSHLSKKEREEFTIPKELKEILVGCLLGDLHARKYQCSVNACLQFSQSTIHADYLHNLYTKFQEFCSQGPKLLNLQPNKKKR